MHGVLSHGFHQQKVINAILDSFGVIFGGGFVQIVVVGASLVINIRVGMTFTLPVVVALDAAHGFLFEFIHMQDKKGHGYCLLAPVTASSRPDREPISPRMFSGLSVSLRVLFPASSTARALVGSPTSFGGSTCS